jgi:hypothetical protein
MDVHNAGAIILVHILILDVIIKGPVPSLKSMD